MKKGFRKSVFLGVAAIVLLSLSACGSGADKESEADSQETETINLGVGTSPHEEIIEHIEEPLAKKGYKLSITTFNDYVLPNTALKDGDLDANLFQHEPYLENYNKEHKSDLAVAENQKLYFLPLGIYGGKTKSLEDVKDGASVAIPDDATNGARALLLLQEADLIKLEDDADITATVSDIKENPQNLEIKELEASQVARSRGDVDLAVINANYALDAGINVKKEALLAEDKDSDAAQTYGNLVAVKKDDQNSKAIKALIEVLTSEDTRKFIDDEFQGAVIPVF